MPILSEFDCWGSHSTLTRRGSVPPAADVTVVTCRAKPGAGALRARSIGGVPECEIRSGESVQLIPVLTHRPESAMVKHSCPSVHSPCGAENHEKHWPTLSRAERATRCWVQRIACRPELAGPCRTQRGARHTPSGPPS